MKTTQKNQHLLQDVTKENQKEIHDYQHTTHIFQTHEKTVRNSDYWLCRKCSKKKKTKSLEEQTID